MSPLIDRNTPLRLARAADLAFPGGGMTAAGLRREAGRGRLTIERVAGKDYVTLAEIEAMRERCRREARGLDSGSARPGAAKNPSGLSETDESGSALAAAQMIADKLKNNSPPISPKSISRRASAAVIRPKFSSPTP
jgi:hypothetical protein